MPSAPQILADSEAYWAAYDAAPTEAARAALQAAFLRAHGANDPEFDGKARRIARELRGGIYPVRPVE